jgi:hypothetical protein
MPLLSRTALSLALCLACGSSFAADTTVDKKTLDAARGFVVAANQDTGA